MSEDRAPETAPAIADPLPEGAASEGGGYATLRELHVWAVQRMRQAPDFVIGPAEAPYLRRWWIVPRNGLCNVYLHEILRSDDDRALHDHPWANTSLLLAGGYIEHTPEGPFVRRAGDVVTRPAETLHRLEVAPGARAISLFMTGPKVREWGFSCPQGWVHWEDFTAADDKGQIGRGCGEHDKAPPARTPFVMPKVERGLTAGRLDEAADVIAHLARRALGAEALANAQPHLADLLRDRRRQIEIEIEELASGQHREAVAIEGVRAQYNAAVEG